MTTDANLMYVRERSLPYPVFDADNHMYENQDALPKFLPREYGGLIKYVDVKGRTKLAIRDHVTNYIPNPTFARVAVPGGYGLDVSKGGKGIGNGIPRGERVQAMPGMEAFFDPGPRLELMRDMGIQRTLLWPTLASALEERLADDHLMFGSDFPHPEGMSDPLGYSEVVEQLPSEDQALIMGGTLSTLMHVDEPAMA